MKQFLKEELQTVHTFMFYKPEMPDKISVLKGNEKALNRVIALYNEIIERSPLIKCTNKYISN